mmetsp:Transcript_26313/g.78136  ORF Transcript_26313/g.78136 Transcript_26313/m.78136 type:complete len:274 (-) Transcript_26313:222-1043(-)
MSFQDLEAGGSHARRAGAQDVRTIEAQVFKMASSVGQIKKLVGLLGGPRDTVDHRKRIADANAAIQDLAKRTKAAIMDLHTPGGAPGDGDAKARKLLQDFVAILQDYKSTQKAAAEKEAASLPLPSPPPRAAAPASSRQQVPDVEQGTPEDTAAAERQALLQAQKARTEAALANSVAFNEQLIEERDAGIEEIAHQIGEVNEMFQDLAVLINDQGVQVNTVDEHISSTAERIKEGSRELVKAERHGRAARNRCLCIWLVAATVVSIIIILLSA